MLKIPCERECPDRTPTCHSECERWIAYEILRNIQYEQTLQEREKKEALLKCNRHYRKKKQRRPYADNRGTK